MVRLVLFFCVCSSVFSQHFEILNMGVFSEEKPSLTFHKYEPIAGAVAASLNDTTMKGDVKLRIFQREADLVNALRAGRIHFAPLHPLTYVRLKEEIPELIIVAGEESEKGFIQSGVIVTPKSVSIRSMEQLKGRGFAFGSMNHPLYDWAARAALVEAGISRGQIMFKNYDDLDRLSELVQVGRYQAGVLPESVVAEEDHPFRILATVKAPGRVWVMIPELLPFLKMRISKSVLAFDDQAVLEKLGVFALIEIDDSDLEPFRRTVAQALKF